MKKLIICILMLILLAVGVSAVDNQSAFYNWSTGSGTNLIDWWTTYNGTINGANAWNSTHYPTYNDTGNSAPYSGDFHPTRSNYVNLGDQTFIETQGNFSISMWFYADENPGTERALIRKWADSNWAYNLGTTNSCQAQWRCLKFDVRSSTGTQKTVNSQAAFNLGEWTHVVVILNGSKEMAIYINGNKTGTSTTAIPQNVGASSESDCIGCKWNAASPTTFWLGKIDDVQIYNKTLTQDQVARIYNFGSLDIVINAAPTLVNISQTPQDVDAFNLFDNDLNITYNITDDVSLNDSTVRVYYKLNSTDTEEILIINGTPISWWQSKSYETNTGDLYEFELDEHDVYPATYNINETLMENTQGIGRTLTNANSWARVNILNISPAKQSSFLEVMINNNSVSGDSAVYYCNSTYKTGNPTINSNCHNLFNIDDVAIYNHTHTSNSSHMVIPFSIINNHVNGVRVSPNSSFLFRGSALGSWNISYISQISRTNAAQTSANNGGSWQNLAGTFNAHVHQYGLDETIYYLASACDEENLCANSTIQSDKLNITNIPPTAPVFITENDMRNNTNVTITWANSTDVNNDSITYFVLFDTVNPPLAVVNSTATPSYTTNYTIDDIYYYQVIATDGTFNSSSLIQNITLDTTLPSITLHSPTPNNQSVFFNGTNILFNATATDGNLIYSVNMSCDDFTDYRSNLLVNTYNYVNYSNFSGTGVQNCSFVAYDSHTARVLERDYTVYRSVIDRRIRFNDIIISTDSMLNDITFERHIDRYSFCFDMIDRRTTIDMYLPHECVHVPNTAYSGHFVCFDKYWVDFEPYDVSVAGNKITVDISNARSRNICFNSVGELNKQQIDFNFTLIADAFDPVVTLIEPANNTNSNTASNSFLYNVTDNSTIKNCSLFINNTLNVTNTSVTRNIPQNFRIDLDDNDYSWFVRCYDQVDNVGDSPTRLLTVNTATISDAMVVTSCPSTTSGTMQLALIIFIAIIFIIIGLAYNLGVFGFFGSLMFMVTSWYVAPCLGLFALIMAFFSFFMMIWFALSGLGFVNKTFR